MWVLVASLLAAAPLHAARPPSQNFDAIAAGTVSSLNGTLTFNGLVYSTDAVNDRLAVDTIANVTGSLPSLGSGNGLSCVWEGTNTGTFFQFASANAADAFSLVSFQAQVFGHSSNNAEIYTIRGYNQSGEVASATVNFRSSGTYGSGNSTLSYTRLTTPAETTSSSDGSNCGKLTFTGSAWQNVNRVRMTVADTAPNTILTVAIDLIELADPVLPDTTPPTVASVVRLTPSSQSLPSGTGSVTFRVTFSEAVQGVTAANFALVSVTGSVSGTIGTPSAVSASVYDVTVSSLSGTGEFRLNVVN